MTDETPRNPETETETEPQTPRPDPNPNPGLKRLLAGLPAVVLLTLALGAWLGSRFGAFEGVVREYERLAVDAMADRDFEVARIANSRLLQTRGNLPQYQDALELALLEIEALRIARNPEPEPRAAQSNTNPNSNPNLDPDADPEPRPDDPDAAEVASWNHASRLRWAQTLLDTADYPRARATLEPGWTHTRAEPYRQALVQLYERWTAPPAQLDDPPTLRRLDRALRLALLPDPSRNPDPNLETLLQRAAALLDPRTPLPQTENQNQTQTQTQTPPNTLLRTLAALRNPETPLPEDPRALRLAENLLRAAAKLPQPPPNLQDALRNLKTRHPDPRALQNLEQSLQNPNP